MEEQSPKANPWPKRLMYLGGICLLLGTLTMFSSSGGFVESSSPISNNIHTQNGISQFDIEVDQVACYKLVTVFDDPEITATLNNPLTDDGTIQPDNCLPDFEPQDNVNGYVVIDSWQLNEGTYRFEIECEGTDCADVTLYVVNANKIMQSVFSLPMILACSLCSLAFLILPLAGILVSIEGRKKKVVMLTPDGTPMQFQSIDEMNKMILEGRFQNQNQNQPSNINNTSVPDPFAEPSAKKSNQAELQNLTSQDNENENGFDQVRSGQLLTTNQIYALMQGDLERAKDITMQNIGVQHQKKPEANYASSQDIDAWDSGAPIQQNETKNPQQKRTTSPRKQTNEPSKWKEWDES